MLTPQFTLPLLEWISIPAGKVIMPDFPEPFDVAPFAIARYPVTVAQFISFHEDSGYREDRYWQGLGRRELALKATLGTREANHPVEGINWYEAMAFTRWLAEKTGLPVTLPTEIQWQWAAAGDTGWRFPYGDQFDAEKCNTAERWKSTVVITEGITGLTSGTSAVDSYPQGASPFGVMDMCGNVCEWCLNLGSDPLNTDVASIEKREMRGGAFCFSQEHATVSTPRDSFPSNRFKFCGFRVAVGAHFY